MWHALSLIRGPTTACRTPWICLLLGVGLAWFYKWLGRAIGPSASSGLHMSRDRRRGCLEWAVRVMFTKKRGLHGSSRLHVDLRGWLGGQREDGCGLDAPPGAGGATD